MFGVKQSLVVDLKSVSDVPGMAEKYKVSPSTKLLAYDFVLVTDQETADLRNQKALEALQKSGATGLQVIDGLLVPDVD